MELIRIGAWYEALGDDAELAAKVLDKRIVERGKPDARVRACGVPYHELDAAKAKLEAAGYSVSVRE